MLILRIFQIIHVSRKPRPKAESGWMSWKWAAIEPHLWCDGRCNLHRGSRAKPWLPKFFWTSYNEDDLYVNKSSKLIIKH